MSFTHNRRTWLFLLPCDLLAVVTVFNVVTYLRGSTTHVYFFPILAPLLVLVAAIRLVDGYGSRADMLSLDYASLHLIASMFAGAATLLLTYGIIPKGFELQSSRASLILSFCVLGPLTLEYRRFFFAHTAAARDDHEIVFVGEDADFEAFTAECLRMGKRLPPVKVGPGSPFGSISDVLAGIERSEIRVEAIVIRESARDLPPDIPIRLVKLYFEGVPTYTLEMFHQVYWRKIPLYRINPVWLFQEGFQITREPVFERLKRATDIAMAAAGLALSAPLVGLAAIAIKLEDGGPVFFRQTRIGLNGTPFKLTKLRTMRESSALADPYTRIGDARITRVGKLLRAGRLDELPQLWNVLRGQMSLIGPRAEWDRLVFEYEQQIPCYHFRHLVKPGITGWAQVNYRYGANLQDTLRKLEYDLYYIRNFSFVLDASIVLKTMHIMLFRRGR